MGDEKEWDDEKDIPTGQWKRGEQYSEPWSNRVPAKSGHSCFVLRAVGRVLVAFGSFLIRKAN